MTSLTPVDRALLRLLGRHGGLLTAGEAASRCGCPLFEVESALLRLAVAGGADLRVGEDGTLAYRFGPHLRRRLLARSWRMRVEVALSWLWQRIFGLIRLSFGLVLIALVSVVTLLVVVLVLIQILGSDDGPEVVWELLKAGLELLVRLLVMLLSDGFKGGGWDGKRRQGPVPQQSAAPAVARGTTGGKRFAFLEAVYSVLFGDGDPNWALERRRWIRIGCFLQHRGGAVIAEDLAPLLDLPPRPQEHERATELADGAMLAVLQRFDGRPAVSEHGDLAFHFPSLQVLAPSASPTTTPMVQPMASAPAAAGAKSTGPIPAQEQAPRVERPAPALRERAIPFSRTTVRQRRIYAGLCAALLVLSPLLLAMAHPAPAPLVGLALFAMAYALLLLLVPLLRLLVLRRRNRRIALRNAGRRSWSRAHPGQHGLLQRKRRFARSFARRIHLGDGELAYTTEQGLLEQEIDSANGDGIRSARSSASDQPGPQDPRSG